MTEINIVVPLQMTLKFEYSNYNFHADRKNRVRLFEIIGAVVPRAPNIALVHGTGKFHVTTHAFERVLHEIQSFE